MNEDDTRDPIDDRLDAMLRETFAPPTDSAFAAMARAARAPKALPRSPWFAAGFVAAAAVVVALVLLFARDRDVRGPEGHDGPALGAMWVAAYQHALSTAGDKAVSCCDPDLDFCACCEEKFAVRLALDAEGPRARVRGCYSGLPTGGCVTTILDTDEGQVAVFAVPRGCDPGPRLPEGSGLQLVRREIGDLVLYAVAGQQQPSAQRELEQFALMQ